MQLLVACASDVFTGDQDFALALFVFLFKTFFMSMLLIKI